MTLPYSEHVCVSCSKKLLNGLYISLTDDTHQQNDRYCYECQKKMFGLSFWNKRKEYQSRCFFCNIDLYRRDLFDFSKKYYIFTDVADACQIAFCKQCFEEASLK
jgi:hypothetical protein